MSWAESSPRPNEVASPEMATLTSAISELRAEYEQLRALVVQTREAMILQEVGIYEYSHPLDDSAAYKAELSELQTSIKGVISSGGAVTTAKKWVINGSEKDGTRMVTDFGKLVLRAYNTEADNLVRSLRPHSLEAALARLQKLRDAVAKLGASMKLGITDAYHALRERELRLTADFLAKVAEEREREREERARLKEEEAAQREFEREKAKLEKERSHYAAAAQALLAKGDGAAAAEAEAHVQDLNKAIEGVVTRAANIRAGYVYVISNVGAFGDGVVKIGLTRRLEPMERVRELGDASVPFRFDIHALIFSDDAVGLESSLHEQFASSRVNLVNNHREFFYVKPADVKTALMALRGDLLSFVESPEALEWHQSENVRRSASSTPSVP